MPQNEAPEVSAEGRRLVAFIDELENAVTFYESAGSEIDAASARLNAARSALSAYVAGLEAEVARWRAVLDIRGHSFGMDDSVRKRSGSSWHGRVVGFYSTDLTPIGYAVESSREPGSVQIYPEAALELDPDAAHRGPATKGQSHA